MGAIGSAATHWKTITGINTANLKASVAFGTRNTAITYTTGDKSATYKSIGMDDVVQFEAFWQGRGFEDLRAVSALATLQATMIGEEALLLGGNASSTEGIAMDGTTTCAPTLAVSATGGVTAVTNTVKIVPLNLFGYLGRTVSSAGITTAIPIANGKGIAGVTADSTNVTNKRIVATWTGVNGAVAYAVYVGIAAGPWYLQDVVTTNSWDSGASAALTATGQSYAALTTPGTDLSQDANDFSGIITQAFMSGSGSYLKSLDGIALTADNACGITQLDAMLKWFWDNKRIGPTVILLNAQEALNITSKVVGSTGTGAGFRIAMNMGADQKTLTGGFYVTGCKTGAPSLRNQGCKHSVNSVNAAMQRLSQAPSMGKVQRLETEHPALPLAA
jgi:hypothetical protein